MARLPARLTSSLQQSVKSASSTASSSSSSTGMTARHSIDNNRVRHHKAASSSSTTSIEDSNDVRPVAHLLEEALATPLPSTSESGHGKADSIASVDSHVATPVFTSSLRKVTPPPSHSLIPPPRALLLPPGIKTAPPRERSSPNASSSSPKSARWPSPPRLMSRATGSGIPVAGVVNHTSYAANTIGIGLTSHHQDTGLPGDDSYYQQRRKSTKGKERELILQGSQDHLDESEMERQTSPNPYQTRPNSIEMSRSVSSSQGAGGSGFMFPGFTLPTLPFSASAATFSNPFATPSTESTSQSLPNDPSPLTMHRSSSTSDVPPWQLQRTISSLMSVNTSPPHRSTSEAYLSSLARRSSTTTSTSSNLTSGFPFASSSFTIPKPSLPSLSFSTSAPDSLDWKTWWNGPGGELNKKDEKAKKKAHDLLSEEDKGEDMEDEEDKIQIKYQSPKNPIVFCHGLLGFDHLGPASLPALQISHWRGIREVLEANGTEVLITRVPATSSVADRAKILEKTIEEHYPGREVNMIGHSMGGLDCRYLISKLKPLGFKVVSLTTIATPHKGSAFADYMVDNIIGRENLPSLLNLVDVLKLPNQGDGSAFQNLGTSRMKNFNVDVPDDPNVKYYSWGAAFEPGLLDTFRWPHGVILDKEGPNDGMVSVESAKHGEYRGTLVGVNHLDLVGWVNHVRYTLSAWSGKEIAFKPATFYLEVADYLAKQGF